MSIGLATILLVGIGANYPNPGTFIQVNFAAGPTSAGPAAQTALIIGNKTSAGAATPDTVIYGPDTSTSVQSETDVITQFGAGSQLHRAWKRFQKVNKGTPVYFVAAAESAGAQATGVVLITGTATTGGTARVYYGDEFIDTAINVGDTATTIATNVAASLTNQINWGITASSSAGQVNITAKNHGPEENWIRIQALNGPGPIAAGVTVNAYGATWATGQTVTTSSFTVPTVANGYYYKVTTAGSGTTGSAQPTWPTTIGTATTADSNGVVWTCWGTLSGAGIVTLGGGATADNYTNALATVLSSTYYNIILCDSDATNVGRVVTQVTSQALPTTGIRQRVFYGSMDTLANAITVATGINSPRAEEIWGGAALDITPLEVAATMAGIYSLYEQTGNTGYRYVGRCNFSLFPTQNALYQDSAVWPLVGSRNGPGLGPTTANITSALNNGVTPVTILSTGQAQLVKAITTHSLNGSTNDYRIRDHHRVPIMDAVATAMQTVTNQQFGGMDLLDPPKTGQAPAAGQPPNVFATNYVLWGNCLKDIVSKVGNAGLLQNTDATNSAAIVQREVSPPDRMSASFDLQTVNVADQFAVVCNQVA
jgi:phage tail sheath gpL-like